MQEKTPEGQVSILDVIERIKRSLPPAQGGQGAPLDEAAVERFTNAVLVTAIEQGASDLSLEPRLKNVAVRIRVDGVPGQMMTFPKFMQEFVTSRLKVMAQIPAQETPTPKKGWITVWHAGHNYNFRVSTLPSLYGESLLLHILNTDIALNFQALGFSAEGMAALDRITQSSSGLLLLAGPAGSGLTTTAAALLQQMGPMTRRICTQETMREYTLDGAIQTYAARNPGDSMSGYVRTLLDHDPDVLFLGDIRDRESAQAAVDAALSGVLTVATIPAPDAIDALRRLLGFGVDRTLAARALSGVCSQRLVPRICLSCAAENSRIASELYAFGYRSDDPAHPVTLRRGVGCPNCANRGTRGRIGIFEVLAFDATLAHLLSTGTPDDKLREASRSTDRIGMREDALGKIMAGIITLDDANAALGRVV